MRLLFLLLFLALPAQAEVEGGLSLGGFSDYVFRGRLLYDGPSLQPRASLDYTLDSGSSVSGALWMHLPASGEHDGRDFTELDSTLSYNTQVGPIQLSFGHQSYAFFDRSPPLEDTAELFSAVSFDTFLQPKLIAYWDYAAFDYSYLELSLSQGLDFELLSRKWNITPYALVGWAVSADERLYSRSGLEHITYGVLSEFEFKGTTILPTVSYTNGVDRLTKSTFWGGITVQRSF